MFIYLSNFFFSIVGFSGLFLAQLYKFPTPFRISLRVSTWFLTYRFPHHWLITFWRLKIKRISLLPESFPFWISFKLLIETLRVQMVFFNCGFKFNVFKFYLQPFHICRMSADVFNWSFVNDIWQIVDITTQHDVVIWTLVYLMVDCGEASVDTDVVEAIEHVDGDFTAWCVGVKLVDGVDDAAFLAKSILGSECLSRFLQVAGLSSFYALGQKHIVLKWRRNVRNIQRIV